MKRYAVEGTIVPNSLNIWYPQRYQESYIYKGELILEAEDFFKDPSLWSNYLYTSKKSAEEGMETLQENNSQGRYWDMSFKIIEIEID